ncbi:hypothetical protein AOQ84DRAFT_355716 [Glonium stellatum]|uniref:Uncharacterized protein n=1 Tax=Glonium stellatum TaxID=574774 RepID=A0A8E2EWD1_9PEZI|nr:hypothetical protein AOQ84DRAFT_355716 [Glonium stellatum]
MRFLGAPSTLLTSATFLLSFTPLSIAKPYPLEPFDELQNSTESEHLEARCANPCGYYGQLCCAVGQSCYTDSNNQAQCGGPVTAAATANAGGWVYYTTTWVETDYVTRTSVYSSYVGVSVAATPTAASCSQYNQSPCGSICCDSGYYCLTSGTCAYAGGGSSGGIYYTTGTPTATVPFQTPIATGANATITSSQQSSGGLSGGAIAGIVIGVLAGILLLTLLCLFCCARAIFDTVMAIFGVGKNRRRVHEETTYIEEHHSSGGGRRRWYGNRPSRPASPARTGGGLGNALGIGALLGGLALALGLKRRHDRRHDEKSNTVSSYTYSDYTSTSSASSDRRTRNTRHSSRH